jgi:hypothetical protein
MIITAMRDIILVEMRIEIEKAIEKLEILNDLCNDECDIVFRIEKVRALLKEAEKI